MTDQYNGYEAKDDVHVHQASKHFHPKHNHLTFNLIAFVTFPAWLGVIFVSIGVEVMPWQLWLLPVVATLSVIGYMIYTFKMQREEVSAYVTALDQLAQEVQRSEQNTRSAVENSPNVRLLRRADGTIVAGGAGQ